MVTAWTCLSVGAKYVLHELDELDEDEQDELDEDEHDELDEDEQDELDDDEQEHLQLDEEDEDEHDDDDEDELQHFFLPLLVQYCESPHDPLLQLVLILVSAPWL